MPNPGSTYVALANLSLPRENDPEKQADLVLRGETVVLSAKRAETFLRRNPPVIAKAGDVQGAVLLQPRQLSGRMRVPPTPAPGTDGPRPDPPGSSAIQVLQEVTGPPEGYEPQPGTENSPAQDAIDLPPGTRVTSGA